jgi:hypothetical protein
MRAKVKTKATLFGNGGGKFPPRASGKVRAKIGALAGVSRSCVVGFVSGR